MRTLRALLLLATAGCTTDFVSTPPPDPTMTASATAIESPRAAISPKLEAQVCHVNAWTQVLGVGAGATLAVAPLDQGAALLSIPAGGGSVTGFAIDQYGLVVGNPNGSTVRAGTYRSIHAGYVDSRLVAATSDGDRLLIDVVRDDLSQAVEIATAEGPWAAHVPVTHVRDARVMPTAGLSGVSFAAFDAQWQETSSVLATPARTIGMDAAQIGGDSGDTIVAWSDVGSCNIENVLANTTRTTPRACASPYLAPMEGANTTLVFEAGAGEIGRYELRGEPGDFKTFAVLPYLGTSPRATYDGTRLWMSFIDSNGNLVAGFLDDRGTFVGQEIDEQPGHDSYQLEMVDGAPWVFTVNATGFFAYEMCAIPEAR